MGDGLTTEHGVRARAFSSYTEDACQGLIMEIRYFLDSDTGQPHIYGHGVTEEEVESILRGAGEDLPGSRGSRIKLGQTAGGRYLQVIYVPDDDPHRRRRRRKGR